MVTKQEYQALVNEIARIREIADYLERETSAAKKIIERLESQRREALREFDSHCDEIATKWLSGNRQLIIIPSLSAEDSIDQGAALVPAGVSEMDARA